MILADQKVPEARVVATARGREGSGQCDLLFRERFVCDFFQAVRLLERLAGIAAIPPHARPWTAATIRVTEFTVQYKAKKRPSTPAAYGAFETTSAWSLGIGAATNLLRVPAADLLRVPAAAADRAGAVPRSTRFAAETAALLALMKGRRPG